MCVQEEPSKEGGVHSGADSSWGKTHRGSGSFWSLGVEEVRPEAYQGFSLSKVISWVYVSRGNGQCGGSSNLKVNNVLVINWKRISQIDESKQIYLLYGS